MMISGPTGAETNPELCGLWPDAPTSPGRTLVDELDRSS
jgi:hypothetical protein